MASTTTILRSLSSAAGRRVPFPPGASFSSLSAAAAAAAASRGTTATTTSIFRPSSAVNIVSDCSFPFKLKFGRAFCSNVSQLSPITDPEIEAALKDLMAMNWNEIPDSVVNETKRALSKSTDDKAGQEALANVFRAAEASVEFGGVLVTLRMVLDDLNGLSGENVGHLPDYIEDAIKAAYERYTAYLDSFGPGEAYLRKKVETELGTKMIHLKMRCSGIGSEWGKRAGDPTMPFLSVGCKIVFFDVGTGTDICILQKKENYSVCVHWDPQFKFSMPRQVTLIGTSGLSGSYVELRS